MFKKILISNVAFAMSIMVPNVQAMELPDSEEVKSPAVGSTISSASLSVAGMWNKLSFTGNYNALELRNFALRNGFDVLRSKKWDDLRSCCAGKNSKEQALFLTELLALEEVVSLEDVAILSVLSDEYFYSDPQKVHIHCEGREYRYKASEMIMQIRDDEEKEVAIRLAAGYSDMLLRSGGH